MSRTRLYVDPRETLMVQGSKMVLARNGQSCQSRSPDLVEKPRHKPWYRKTPHEWGASHS